MSASPHISKTQLKNHGPSRKKVYIDVEKAPIKRDRWKKIETNLHWPRSSSSAEQTARRSARCRPFCLVQDLDLWSRTWKKMEREDGTGRRNRGGDEKKLSGLFENDGMKRNGGLSCLDSITKHEKKVQPRRLGEKTWAWIGPGCKITVLHKAYQTTSGNKRPAHTSGLVWHGWAGLCGHAVTSWVHWLRSSHWRHSNPLSNSQIRQFGAISGFYGFPLPRSPVYVKEKPQNFRNKTRQQEKNKTTGRKKEKK